MSYLRQHPELLASFRRGERHATTKVYTVYMPGVDKVELLFRELKSGYRLDQMPSRNLHVVQALIYAALLTLAASRRLHRTLTARWKLPRARVPFDRWFGLFAAVAERMLEAMIHRSGRAALLHRLETFLRYEALDPNRRRVPLACRAEMGLHAWS